MVKAFIPHLMETNKKENLNKEKERGMAYINGLI